jgi:hypothetical protein
VAAALLTGTDLLQWRIGLFDGVTGASADRGLLAFLLVSKLTITLAWLLVTVRLAHDPATFSLLRLTRRQLLWLGGLLLILPVALAVRLVLQKVLGALLAPLEPDPRTVMLAGVLAYLAMFMWLQVRFIPALIGVLLGNAEAGLGWSWRRTRGLVLSFIATLLLALLPLFALHFGNSLIWTPEAPVLRLAVLLFDGAVMAALILVGSGAYVSLYRSAKAAEWPEQSGTVDSATVRPAAQ